MRLLSHYVLGSGAVDGWHLWDNCRNEQDRAYLGKLAASDPRCSIKRLPSADGGTANIGDFFRFCDDVEALYLRLDDDVVFTEPGFFERFKARALASRGKALWFAPLIVNNAICNALIQTLSQVTIKGQISFQANCPTSWAKPDFPIAMHPVLIEAVRTGRLDAFRVPDREVRLSRFSINAIAFFGAEIVSLGELFHPPDHNEEEWLSAILPAKLNSCGLVFGDLLVAHFSFFTQEHRVLQTDILEAYYDLAGLPPPHYDKPRDNLEQRIHKWRRSRKPPRYTISLPPAGAA
jgi:hypothetical protein